MNIKEMVLEKAGQAKKAARVPAGVSSAVKNNTLISMAEDRQNPFPEREQQTGECRWV